MGAPKGNQFWKMRSKHGREKIFSSPKILWEAAQEYFQWCDDNPWHRNEVAKAGDHFGEQVTVEIQRPYTLKGLCIFLDVDENTFNNYGNKPEYQDFFSVVSKIRKIIYTQKFEGAVVGTFNSSIIARDLGLVDKSETDITSKGNSIQVIRPKKDAD